MTHAFRAYQQQQKNTSKMEDFLPLVRRIAGKLISRLPPSVELADLVQAGCIGLAQAWSRFSVSEGTPFEAFASSRIRGAMLDWLRSEDLLPKAIRQESKRLDQTLSQLRQRLGREPREEEIAEEASLSLLDYQTFMASVENNQLLSLEDLGVSSPENLAMASSSSDPYEQLLASETADLLTQAIEALPERERLIMSLHHEQDLNFKEISLVLDISEARVCQLHGQSLSRIRSFLSFS